MNTGRTPGIRVVVTIPYSESTATGWPPSNCVAGSISIACRVALALAKSIRNQRPSQ